MWPLKVDEYYSLFYSIFLWKLFFKIIVTFPIFVMVETKNSMLHRYIIFHCINNALAEFDNFGNKKFHQWTWIATKSMENLAIFLFHLMQFFSSIQSFFSSWSLFYLNCKFISRNCYLGCNFSFEKTLEFLKLRKCIHSLNWIWLVRIKVPNAHNSEV